MNLDADLEELAEKLQKRAQEHGTTWNRERNPYDAGATAAFDFAAASVRGLLHTMRGRTQREGVQPIEKS